MCSRINGEGMLRYRLVTLCIHHRNIVSFIRDHLVDLCAVRCTALVVLMWPMGRLVQRWVVLEWQDSVTARQRYAEQAYNHNIITRHRATTSMYSLTFCVRVMSPSRHHWKPAVQAGAVMLRTPPIHGQSPASQPRPLATYGAQWMLRTPPSPAGH